MRLFDIIKKDMLVVLRDFKALIFIFIMPLVLILILSLALGGIFQRSNPIMQINIAIVDHTNSSDVSGIKLKMGANADNSFDADMMSIYSILDSDEVSAFISYQVTDEAKAQGLLEQGAVDAVITIPKDYILNVINSMQGGGDRTEIVVMGSRQSTLKLSIVTGVVQSYTDAISSISADLGVLFQMVMDNGQPFQETISKLDIIKFIQDSAGSLATPGIDIQSKNIEARKVLDSFYYYSIAIACMFILYSAGHGSVFLHTENEEKTLQRLTAAGISNKKLLIGKSFAIFFLCLLQLIILFGFSTLAFGIDWGDPLGLLMTSICTAISVTGLGVLLMVWVYRAGNPRISTVFQSVVVQVVALFGGSYIPLYLLPKFFTFVSLITPNGLAVKAYTENVTGAPLIEILPYLSGSIALGAVLFLIGTMLFPRKRRV
ncbi:MAG: ABC transporter permease [Christensenellales bacterium]|jgi:ABC-2 type transport system permease protein